MSGNINSVTITDITDCEEKDIEIIEKKVIDAEIKLSPDNNDDVNAKEIPICKSDKIHRFLTQSDILKKIIKSCYNNDFINPEFFENSIYSLRYKYEDISSIDNTIIKKFSIGNITYHKIDINVCFSVSKYSCDKIGICDCKIVHSAHRNNCIHCIWKDVSNSNYINSVLSIFYITFHTETEDFEIEKTIVKIREILSSQYKNPKIFFVYKNHLSQKFVDALFEEYGVISVKLGTSFNYWLSHQRIENHLIY